MSRTLHIGLLLHYSYAFYRNVLSGVRQFAETRPEWTFMPVFVKKSRLRWDGKMSPDGLIAAIDNAESARAVGTWGRPIVTIGGALRNLPYPRVAADNVAVGRLAVQHFLERGLKNLAFVGHRNHLTSEEREAAFCEAVKEAGCAPVHCYLTLPHRPYVPQAMQWYLDGDIDPWLLALPKPVGLFVPADIYGAALTQICGEIALRVPEDIAIVGVDNDDVYGRLARPPLSSVLSDARRIGSEAAALLDRLLAGHKPPKDPIRVAPLGVQARRSSEVLAIEDEDVVTAARFIREHAHLPITVADVLRAVSVSRRSLERRFLQALDRGLSEEICRVRLERSKRLLAETDLRMAAVAGHSGFSSTRHLAATFQRELGEPPSQYRRKTRVRDGLG